MTRTITSSSERSTGESRRKASLNSSAAAGARLLSGRAGLVLGAASAADVQKQLEGKTLRKVIWVPGRILNLIVG